MAPAVAQNLAAMVWLVLELAVILAIVANLRPSNRHRAHDFDGTSIHLHVCIFFCNPVRGIRVEPAKWHTVRPSISLSSLEFAHSNRSPD